VKGHEKHRKSLVVNGALASCVLFFVLDLSRSGRGPIDWLVIGAVLLAILWNVVRLGQRLYPYAGGRALAIDLATAALGVAGVLTMAFSRSGPGAPWGTPASWALLTAALAGGVLLFSMERAAIRRMEDG